MASRFVSPETMESLEKVVKEVPTALMKKGKVLMHYGFVPFIILLGMYSEPRPTWSQLLGPV